MSLVSLLSMRIIVVLLTSAFKSLKSVARTCDLNLDRLDYFSTECVYAPFAARGFARDFVKDLEVELFASFSWHYFVRLSWHYFARLSWHYFARLSWHYFARLSWHYLLATIN
jgi:hypothetical protein